MKVRRSHSYRKGVFRELRLSSVHRAGYCFGRFRALSGLKALSRKVRAPCIPGNTDFIAPEKALHIPADILTREGSHDFRAFFADIDHIAYGCTGHALLEEIGVEFKQHAGLHLKELVG